MICRGAIAAALCCIVLFATGSATADSGLRLATWNIYWLGDNGHNRREAADYVSLRAIAGDLAADVIALQEVGDLDTVAKVFPTEQYHLELSTRRSSQLTGFAIRKGVAYTRLPDVATLDVTGGLRYGTVIDVAHADGKLRLMSIHLKSGCFANDLDQPSGDACQKLSKQIAPLEAWIDSNLSAGQVFVVLGDFNRRMDLDNDDLWRNLADGEPGPLFRVNAGVKPTCFGGRFGEFIDHIVVDSGASALVVPESFREINFGDLPYESRRVISDHCPLMIDLYGGSGEASLRESMKALLGDTVSTGTGVFCCKYQQYIPRKTVYEWTSASSCRSVGGRKVASSYCGR